MTPYKRGTWFDYTGILTNRITKLPENIVGATITSQLRYYVAGKPVQGPSGLIANLTGVVVDGARGVYRIMSDQTVAETWPIAKACFDIVFTFPPQDSPPVSPRVPTVGFVVIDIIDASTQPVGP